MADINLLDQLETLTAIDANPALANMQPRVQRGALSQVFAGVGRSIPGIGEMAGEAISLVPGLRGVGEGISEFFDSLQPAPSGGKIEQAVESALTSLGAAGALTGVAATLGVASPLVAAGIGTAALFGAAEAANTRGFLEGINEQLVQRGQAPLSAGEIRAAMAANAGIEAFGEGVANFLFARRFGAGKLFDSAKDAVRPFITSGTVNEALKRVAGAAVERGVRVGARATEEVARAATREAITEAGQAAGQTAVLRSTIGAENVPPTMRTPGQAAREAAEIGALAGVVFAGAGSVINRRARRIAPQEPPGATAEVQTEEAGPSFEGSIQGEGFEMLTPDEAGRVEFQAAARAAATAARPRPLAAESLGLTTLDELAMSTPDQFLRNTDRSPDNVNFREFISNEFLPTVLQSFRLGLRPADVQDPAARSQYIENLNAALRAFPPGPKLLTSGQPPIQFSESTAIVPTSPRQQQAQQEQEAPQTPSATQGIEAIVETPSGQTGVVFVNNFGVLEFRPSSSGIAAPGARRVTVQDDNFEALFASTEQGFPSERINRARRDFAARQNLNLDLLPEVSPELAAPIQPQQQVDTQQPLETRLRNAEESAIDIALALEQSGFAGFDFNALRESLQVDHDITQPEAQRILSDAISASGGPLPAQEQAEELPVEEQQPPAPAADPIAAAEDDAVDQIEQSLRSGQPIQRGVLSSLLQETHGITRREADAAVQNAEQVVQDVIGQEEVQQPAETQLAEQPVVPQEPQIAPEQASQFLESLTETLSERFNIRRVRDDSGNTVSFSARRKNATSSGRFDITLNPATGELEVAGRANTDFSRATLRSLRRQIDAANEANIEALTAPAEEQGTGLVDERQTFLASDPADREKVPPDQMELRRFIRFKRDDGRSGIKLEGETELLSEFRDLISRRQGSVSGLLNDKSGFTPQEMAELAAEHGFLQDANKDELKEAIEDSISGTPRFSSRNTRVAQKLDDFFSGLGGTVEEAARSFQTPGGERQDVSQQTREMSLRGMAAVRAAEAGDTITQTQGNLVIPGRQPLRFTERRRGAGAIELFRGIPEESVLEEMRQTGRSAFEGKIINGHESLAMLGQAVRNPMFETLYRVWVGENSQVLAVDGLSSRLPGSAGAFLLKQPVRPGTRRSKTLAVRAVSQLRRRKQRMGATGYYLLHNHPSGDPTPSSADVVMTNIMARNVPGFQGHVVIDSGTYATLDQDGFITMQDITAELDRAEDPFLTPRDPAQLPVIETNRSMVPIGKALSRKGFVVSIFTANNTEPGATNHVVRGLMLIPEGLFSADDIRGYIQNRKTEFGATNVGVYYDGETGSVFDRGVELFDDGTIGEFLGSQNAEQATSLMESSVPANRSTAIPRTLGVQQPQRPFQAEGQQRQFKAITPEIESKLFRDYATFSNMFPENISAAFGQEFAKERISMPALDEEASAWTSDWAENPGRFNRLITDIFKGNRAATEAQVRAMQSISQGMWNDMRARLEGEAITQEEFTQFENRWFQSNGLVNALVTSSSTAGRILRSLRESPPVDAYRQFISTLEEGRDAMSQEEFDQLMNRARDAYATNDRETLRSLGNQLQDPRLRDYFFEFYYGSILSSPATFNINLFSTFGFIQFHNAIVRSTMGFLDPFVARLQGRERQFYAQEALPSFASAFRGIPKGAGRFWSLFRHGRVPEEASKFSRDMGRAVGAWERAKYQQSIPALGIVEGQPIQWMRKLAPVITFASRALGAADVALREIAFDSDLKARAVRASIQQNGRRDAEFERNYIETIGDRPAEQRAILEQANEKTFVDAPSEFATLVTRVREAPAVGWLFQMITPFSRTPDRLIARGLEFTPGVKAIPEIWKSIEWQGWLPKGIDFSKNPNPQLTEIFAKQLIGTILTGTFYALWKSGRLTGDVPDDEAERASFFREGKLPFSYIANDGTIIQWRRFEPLSLPLGLAVNGFEAIDRIQKKRAENGEQIFQGTAGDKVDDTVAIGTAVAHSMVNFIIDGSYYRGVAEFMAGATQRPSGNIQRGLVRQFVTAVVPFVSAQRAVNRFLDAMTHGGEVLIRERETPLQEFQESIVGVGRTPARRGAFGQPLTQRPTQPVEALGLPPFRTSRIRTDRVEDAMKRAKFNPGLPRRSDVERSLNRKVTEDEFRQYVIIRGQNARQNVENLIGTNFFQSLSVDDQRKRLQTAFRRASREARRQLKRGTRRQESIF